MWIWIQATYAIIAWSVALRAVIRSARINGQLEPALLKLVQKLVATKQEAQIEALCDELNAEAISEVIREPVLSAEDVFARVKQAIAMSAPPTTAMRGMATIGTSLGLLGAIATMRSSFDTGASQGAVAQAIQCALLGFVTAIPLWTAIGVCAKHVKPARIALDKLAEIRENLPNPESAKDQQLAGVKDT